MIMGGRDKFLSFVLFHTVAYNSVIQSFLTRAALLLSRQPKISASARSIRIRIVYHGAEFLDSLHNQIDQVTHHLPPHPYTVKI
jgi:hypothetical protein